MKRTVLLVCEGRETERNYLDGLKREEAVTRRFAVTVARGRGGSRLQIVQRAVDCENRFRDDCDEVWCVMDVERLDSAETRTDFQAAVRLARDNDVTLCLSNPSVEIWFLAHFLRTSRTFNDCEAVLTELNRHWNAAFRQDYSKTDVQIYAKLRPRTDAAIDNAKAVREQDHGERRALAECNSSTEVYRLVEYLLRGTRHVAG